MSEHSNELTGPDLAEGVDISSVSPGEMVAGHAFGEPVLLARVEPNWFAVGAKCTHYSAPLADGSLVGETIRGPWHHACFNLRNGAAARGPALNDLPVYDVQIENNRVRVPRKREAGSHRDEVRQREWQRGLTKPELRAWREGEHVMDVYYGSKQERSLKQRVQRKIRRVLIGL